jgi:hypothetical protein
VSKLRTSSVFTIKASTEETDCNVEECAPDKEVISFLPSLLLYLIFSFLFLVYFHCLVAKKIWRKRLEI